MKYCISILLLLVFVLTIAVNQSYCQKTKTPFKGIITFDVEYEGNIDSSKNNILNKEIKYFISGNKSKTTISQGGVDITKITDGDKKTRITLMDIPTLNKKIAFKETEEEIIKKAEKNIIPTIKYLDETRKIAGKKCKKAEITKRSENGKEIISFFYYTEVLGSPNIEFDNELKDVKGIILEREEFVEQLKITYTANKIRKSNISDKEFLIPAGYQEMTTEQIKSLFSGKL